MWPTSEVTYDLEPRGDRRRDPLGLEGGTYTVVATNDYGCKDTLDVTGVVRT